NIIIYWLIGNPNAAEIISENIIHYSIITEIEVKGDTSMIKQAEKDKLQKILNRFKKIPLGEEIKEIAIKYKIQYNLKTPDAIIAASARFLKLPLVTGDKKVLQVDNIITVLFDPDK
ncbi:MAG: PIN domain-containing protein, partial [Bacteroidota bacterium]|nr:PIN domain-containing protein [Bacteroidota bacterium]